MEFVINGNNKYVRADSPEVEFDRVTEVIGATVGRADIERWKKRVGEEQASMISESASEWGTRVHEITAIADRSKSVFLPNPKLEEMLTKYPELLPSLNVWNQWVKNTIRKWVLVEQVVWSDKLRIAGTIDRVGYIKGDTHPSIIDIKTGGLWDSAGIQVWGAYRELYNGNRGRKKEVKRGVVVQIPREEPGKIHVKDVSKEEYIRKWEDAKLDWNNIMGRNG